MHKTTFDLGQWKERMRQKFAISRAHAMDSGNWHYQHGISALSPQEMPIEVMKWRRLNNAFDHDFSKHNAVYADSSDYKPYDVFAEYSEQELLELQRLWSQDGV